MTARLADGPRASGAARGAPRSLGDILSIGTLRETRSYLRGRWAYATVTIVALGVAIVSLTVGGMLELFPTQGAYTAEVIWWGAPSAWWYYPEVLIVQPWGILQLPFLPTVAMILVSVGAGIGAAVALRVARASLRPATSLERRPAAAGVAAGGGAGIVSIATVGACCCTTCATAGGLAAAAVVSGTSVAGLLGAEWYLPLFQLFLVYLALLAQEGALRQARTACAKPPALGRRFLLGAALRLSLLLAGATWSVSMFIEWGSVSPLTAPPSLWYHWVVEHQLLSLAAIAAALFPRGVSGLLLRSSRGPTGRAVRIALAIGAVSWGAWVPSPLVAAGLGGFLNELFGVLGLPSALGAAAIGAPAGASLYFHWVFQHLLLAAFALIVAAAPEKAARPLLWTVGDSLPPVEEPEPAPTPDEPGAIPA